MRYHLLLFKSQFLIYGTKKFQLCVTQKEKKNNREMSGFEVQVQPIDLLCLKKNNMETVLQLNVFVFMAGRIKNEGRGCSKVDLNELKCQ